MRLSNPIVRAFVEEKLPLGWSPELIAGRLPIEHPGLKTNYESIYLPAGRQVNGFITSVAT